MKKLIAISIILISFNLLNAQRSEEYLFYLNNSIDKVQKEVSREIEKDNRIISLKDLINTFHVIHIVPDSFTNNNYKDTTIKINRNGSLYEESDSKIAFEIEYYYLVFNSNSKVTKYGYSGCPVCAHTPYYFDIFYNNDVRVNKMEMFMFGQVAAYIDIEYNNIGDVILVEQHNVNGELNYIIKQNK